MVNRDSSDDKNVRELCSVLSCSFLVSLYLNFVDITILNGDDSKSLHRSDIRFITSEVNRNSVNTLLPNNCPSHRADNDFKEM